MSELTEITVDGFTYRVNVKTGAVDVRVLRRKQVPFWRRCNPGRGKAARIAMLVASMARQ
jgi:hypothetical protein